MSADSAEGKISRVYCMQGGWGLFNSTAVSKSKLCCEALVTLRIGFGMILCLALRRVCARVWLTHHCSLKEGVGEGGKGGGRVEGGGVGVERWRLVLRQVERNLSVHFLSTTSAHCT